MTSTTEEKEQHQQHTEEMETYSLLEHYDAFYRSGEEEAEELSNTAHNNNNKGCFYSSKDGENEAKYTSMLQNLSCREGSSSEDSCCGSSSSGDEDCDDDSLVETIGEVNVYESLPPEEIIKENNKSGAISIGGYQNVDDCSKEINCNAEDRIDDNNAENDDSLLECDEMSPLNDFSTKEVYHFSGENEVEALERVSQDLFAVNVSDIMNDRSFFQTNLSTIYHQTSQLLFTTDDTVFNNTSQLIITGKNHLEVKENSFIEVNEDKFDFEASTQFERVSFDSASNSGQEARPQSNSVSTTRSFTLDSSFNKKMSEKFATTGVLSSFDSEQVQQQEKEVNDTKQASIPVKEEEEVNTIFLIEKISNSEQDELHEIDFSQLKLDDLPTSGDDEDLSNIKWEDLDDLPIPTDINTTPRRPPRHEATTPMSQNTEMSIALDEDRYTKHIDELKEKIGSFDLLRSSQENISVEVFEIEEANIEDLGDEGQEEGNGALLDSMEAHTGVSPTKPNPDASEINSTSEVLLTNDDQYGDEASGQPLSQRSFPESDKQKEQQDLSAGVENIPADYESDKSEVTTQRLNASSLALMDVSLLNEKYRTPLFKPSMSEIDALPRLYALRPLGSPSPFEVSTWYSAEIIKHVLVFLGPFDVVRMGRVNKYTNSYISQNLQVIMKNVTRSGGISSSIRGQFWYYILSNKFQGADENKHFSEEQYENLSKEGASSKWAPIIHRDVLRAFGTLPPHKTGAKVRPDSIIKYLVPCASMRKFDEDENTSSTSTDELLDRVDTVSDWGGASYESNLALSGSLSSSAKLEMQMSLGNILYALSAEFRTVGYCQGMDYVVAHIMRVLNRAFLPKIMSSQASLITTSNAKFKRRLAEMTEIKQKAVKTFENVVFNTVAQFFNLYNLKHMYWPELRCLKTCCRVFERLISIKLPVLADHFEYHDLNVGLFALGWFQTLFLYLPSMPQQTVCHMWDIWIVERSYKIFFRIGVAILFLSQPQLLNQDMEGMMTYLNTIPDATLLKPDILIPCALRFKVTNRMLKEIEEQVS